MMIIIMIIVMIIIEFHFISYFFFFLVEKKFYSLFVWFLILLYHHQQTKIELWWWKRIHFQDNGRHLLAIIFSRFFFMIFNTLNATHVTIENVIKMLATWSVLNRNSSWKNAHTPTHKQILIADGRTRINILRSLLLTKWEKKLIKIQSKHFMCPFIYMNFKFIFHKRFILSMLLLLLLLIVFFFLWKSRSLKFNYWNFSSSTDHYFFLNSHEFNNNNNNNEKRLN